MQARAARSMELAAGLIRLDPFPQPLAAGSPGPANYMLEPAEAMPKSSEKAKFSGMPEEPIAFGPFVLGPGNGTILRDGEPLAIGQRAVLLLEALARSTGRVRTKAELMDAAWRTPPDPCRAMA